VINCKRGILVKCLVCGFNTLTEERSYEICPICRWEDDPWYYLGHPPDEATGGPNGDVSLTEARENFKKYLTSNRPNERIYFRFSQSDEVKKLKRELMDAFKTLEETVSEDMKRQLKSKIDVIEKKISELIFGK